MIAPNAIQIVDLYYAKEHLSRLAGAIFGSNSDLSRKWADDYIHIHVIPAENSDLLNKTYPCSGKGMEDTWRTSLKEQSKYVIISPKDLLTTVIVGQYCSLHEYLEKRYW
jgi:hypothetical protein